MGVLKGFSLVMRPHCVVDTGRTLESLRRASWPGLDVEQKICRSSHALETNITVDARIILTT